MHTELRNVIKSLIEAKVTFSVCVGINRLKLKGFEMNSKEFFVVMLKKDLKKINPVKHAINNSYRDIAEILMSETEMRYFKENSEMFTRVQFNEYGRVYELKNVSFKEYRCKNKPKQTAGL